VVELQQCPQRRVGWIPQALETIFLTIAGEAAANAESVHSYQTAGRSEIQIKRGVGYPSNRSLPILSKMNPRS